LGFTSFFNAGGLIFYTDLIDATEDFSALTALASIEAVKGYLASPAGQRLALSVAETFGVRIPGLVAVRAPADTARFGDSVGIASMLAVMGFV